MEKIIRKIKIGELLQKNKVLIVYGPRQVGKTTLIKDYLETSSSKYLYYTGEQHEFSNFLSDGTLNNFKREFGQLDLLVIDEAQLIDDVGKKIKLIVDSIDTIKVILTGSSALDLSNKASEPLTGRKIVCNLYPISYSELSSQLPSIELSSLLEEHLIYGLYPAVLTKQSSSEKEEILREITDSYLLKDILAFDLVKSSKIIRDLLRLLAFRIGSEVSLSELGANLGIDKNTVSRYLDLLEKSFIIFRLGALSRNLRKEVYKTGKYYFYDLGIRNALISNFNRLELRNDVGGLWENFNIVERMKRNSYDRRFPNYYFWRTYEQKEIDFIEEIDGALKGFEFKWARNVAKEPIEFLESYESSSWEIINKQNFAEFVS